MQQGRTVPTQPPRQRVLLATTVPLEPPTLYSLFSGELLLTRRLLRFRLHPRDLLPTSQATSHSVYSWAVLSHGGPHCSRHLCRGELLPEHNQPDHLPRRKLLPCRLDSSDFVCGGGLLPERQLRPCCLCGGLLLLHIFLRPRHLPCWELLPRRLDGGKVVRGGGLLPKQQLRPCFLCSRLLLLHPLFSADDLPHRELLPRRLHRRGFVRGGRLLPQWQLLLRLLRRGLLLPHAFLVPDDLPHWKVLPRRLHSWRLLHGRGPLLVLRLFCQTTVPGR